MKESGIGLRHGRASRMSMIVVALLAASLFGAPSFLTNGAVEGPVTNAAAVDPSRVFTVGAVEMAISTLNPYTYTMADEWIAIFPCYSTLITYDAEVNMVGDLATSWEMSSDGLTWTFKIVNNALVCDNRDLGNLAYFPIKARDVIYSMQVVQNYSSNLHFYLPGEIDGVPNTIAEFNEINEYEVEFVLSGQYAPFLNAMISIPIVPKDIVKPLVDAAGGPSKVKNFVPMGSGAFYYAMTGLPESNECVLKPNPQWFQTANRGWQLHISEWKLRDCGDANTAWLELTEGNIDTFMGVAPDVYLDTLPGTPDVIGFAQSTGFVYEYNLNQMSDEMREELGGNFQTATNNQILLDPVVKEAMAMCVDKNAFVSTVLRGLGNVADSLMPDISPWYYDYGSTPGEVEFPFDPDGARELLWNNGWKYDAAGREVAIDGDQCPLYGYFEGELKPLEFRFVTLTPDPEWDTGGRLLVDWAEMGGVKLNMELKAYSEMNNLWYAADYDTWLWDWMFTPLSDPSTDVLSVLTTMEIGTWSDIYWSCPEFDDLYNQSLVAMDPVVRGEIIDEMQRVAYEDPCCQCIAYRKELYAVSTKYWTNYGDWNTSWILMPDQGYPYLYMRISPNGPDADPSNKAPVITSLANPFEGEVGVATTFTGAASDTSPLQYQWYFGDGTASGWLSSATTTHTYAEDGVYVVNFAVRETDGPDLFITSKPTTAEIVDDTNVRPYGQDFTFAPLSPDSGDVVTFTGSATDPDDPPEDLFYTWNFGDGYSGMGQVVTHQFTSEGFYTVTMYVTDNHLSDTYPRPVSIPHDISVAPNGPPTISVPDVPTGVQKSVPYTFSVTASDPDGDPLRFTWVWGDGSTDVTTSSSTSHTYSTKGVYMMTVYADDLSNLPNHNVSDYGFVSVGGVTNTAPVVTAFTASDMAPYTGEVITFSASARDAEGDPIRFTFSFGDGTYAVFQGPATTPNKVTTFTVEKAYEFGGYQTARVYAWDYQANTTSTPLSINVIPNEFPEVFPMVDKYAVADEVLDFYADAIDFDFDTLTYTWDFGDGTSPVVVVGDGSATHAYTECGEFVFRVWVDDAHGHVVTTAAIAYVQVEYTMDLVEGWNLVTLPLVDHGYRASTLGLVAGDVVAGWNPATESYDKLYYVGYSPPSYDFDIDPCVGYWISVGTTKSLTLAGYEASGMVYTLVDVPSGGGWALLGVPSLEAGLYASDVAAMYDGEVTAVAVFNAATKSYQSYYPAYPITDFLVSPGSGMWLMCATGAWFTYAAA